MGPKKSDFFDFLIIQIVLKELSHFDYTKLSGFFIIFHDFSSDFRRKYFQNSIITFLIFYKNLEFQKNHI